jgi:hypothetical protein
MDFELYLLLYLRSLPDLAPLSGGPYKSLSFLDSSEFDNPILLVSLSCSISVSKSSLYPQSSSSSSSCTLMILDDKFYGDLEGKSFKVVELWHPAPIKEVDFIA